jgi:RNA 2',3'-cyclic 3'-phosphodiesterase
MADMNSHPDSEGIRTFIAMQLTEELRQGVQTLQSQLRQEIPSQSVRWTRTDQVHLTLKFLGDVPASAIDRLAAALSRACAGQGILRLRLERLGCFPDVRFPKILWVGVSGERERLQSVQSRLEQETAWLLARKEDRPFHPHLTIARLRPLSPRDCRRLEQVVQASEVLRLGDWIVQEVVLMKSVLAKEGPTYTPLAVIPLATT